MPEPQRLLHERLGWPTEYPVVTGNPKWHAALMDLAHPDLKIAVECDGPSHQSKQQQVRDRIKERMLNDLGWIVLRFTNEVILERTAMVLEQIQSVAQQRA